MGLNQPEFEAMFVMITIHDAHNVKINIPLLLLPHTFGTIRPQILQFLMQQPLIRTYYDYIDLDRSILSLQLFHLLLLLNILYRIIKSNKMIATHTTLTNRIPPLNLATHLALNLFVQTLIIKVSVFLMSQLRQLR